MKINITEKSDEQLVREVQKRKQDSLDILIKRHLPKAKDVVFNVFGGLEPQDFQDALQTTMIKIWNKIPEFRGDCAFFTWFLHILKNETYSLIRKKIVRNKYEISSDRMKEEQELQGEEFVSDTLLDDLLWQNPENALEKRENATILRKMLDSTMLKLSSNHLKILKLFLEEKSYKEISLKLKISEGTVMSRVYYAKKHLQKLIENYSRKHHIELPLTNFKK